MSFCIRYGLSNPDAFCERIIDIVFIRYYKNQMYMPESSIADFLIEGGCILDDILLLECGRDEIYVMMSDKDGKISSQVYSHEGQRSIETLKAVAAALDYPVLTAVNYDIATKKVSVPVRRLIALNPEKFEITDRDIDFGEEWLSLLLPKNKTDLAGHIIVSGSSEELINKFSGCLKRPIEIMSVPVGDFSL